MPVVKRLVSGLGVAAAGVALTLGLGGTAAAAPAPAPAPAPVVAPTPAAAPAIPCSLPTTGSAACIDVSAKKAWLVENGQVVKTVSALGGRSGHRTPTGTFQVEWKDPDHVSKTYDNAPMPYSVFFAPGIATHGGSLAERSHGCVHLSTANAKTFYNALGVGDTVQVVS